MLRLTNVSVNLGGFQIIKDVSMEIAAGECVALLGSNGAGKSTLFRAIVGLLKVSEGTIEFKGEPIHRVPAEKIVAKGIALCPEGRFLFPNLSVYKNLLLGAYTRKCSAREIQESIEEKYELFPILKSRKDQPAGTLSGGEQQMLAIARALMSNPELLLLDEPSIGLAPQIVKKIAETITAIAKKGTTVLLSEQNANMALQVTSRGYVLEAGRVMLAGSSSELRDNERVKRAYLGA